MAAKGTAAKSSSGASMSKYDVEVEARLKALEAAVAELKEHSHPDRGGDVDTSGDHDLEVSIGRIPSRNKDEAKEYVDKLVRYSQERNL